MSEQGEVLQQETPRKQRRGVAPDLAGAVAQHNNDYVFTRTRPACDQAFACTIGVTGLHTIAVRDPSKQFVRVFKLAGAAIRIAEDKLWKTDDGTDGRIRVSSACDEREIACARVLSR